MEEWYRKIVLEEQPGVGPALVRWLLLPLSWLYSVVIETYKLLFTVGLLKRVHLPCRVVSLGNLTMGGVGKTVAVQAAALALQRAGIRCVILSYGYRAGSKGDYAVVSDLDGVLMGPEEAGDEACMLASALPGIPVIIGKRRPLSGAAAVRLFQPDVILLDDGFQHWRLARDVDLVLLDARRPLGNGRVFPAGILREQAASLRRAGGCILTRCDSATAVELEAARETLNRLAPGSPVLGTSHVIGTPYLVPTGPRRGLPPPHQRELWQQAGVRFCAVSGIGQNSAFLASLLEAGYIVPASLEFPNHHQYNPIDVCAILRQAEELDAVVTTEKDAVKLADLWCSPVPLLALPVT
ncbi:MAG: tetraacyldisaccharide 4'-kinase, partial [Armatimonadota bacterium]|nr:tetraacyldisaccharide 4'-kinase [Armatimonadota bacterium]